MNRKLIDDWRRAWKWMSVRCMAVAVTIQGAWLAVPDDMRGYIPHMLVAGLTVVLLIAGIIGRITTPVCSFPPQHEENQE